METASSAPLIRLEKAAFRLGDRRVFEDTTWEIRKGTHWALLGPNGGGKTAFARALCRELPLVSGKIEYFFDPPGTEGILHSRSYPVRNEILRLSPDTPDSLFGQYGGFYQARWQSFTSEDAPRVAELIDTAATVKSESGKASDYSPDAIISGFGLHHLMHKRVVHLSNGEARKVAIARALMLRPHLLILDDPFSGLDRSARPMLRSVIDDLISAGWTQILLITHRLEEIPESIENILIVDRLAIKRQADAARFHVADSDNRHRSSLDPEKMEPVATFETAPLPGAAPTIDMQDVTIAYGGIRILDRINWCMRSGEHWALIGPNGAGKSTLLSLILADNPQAYANRIYLFGTRRGSGESIWDIKQRIGWVSAELQSYHPVRTTCFDAVCSGFFDTVGLYRRASSREQKAAADRMASTGISHLGSRRLAEVSTGEKRLVLLARALVKNPELLVLDEPCQGLDATSRRHFLSLIDSICREKALSMIYVTHHTDELPESITHVLMLNGGTVHTCGRIAGR